jgi:hypothetical protein
MKLVVAIVLTLAALQTHAASFERSRVCRDVISRSFPWTLFMSVEKDQVTKVWFAEQVAVGAKPVFKELKSLIPDPANKISRGGFAYKIEIETVQGVIAGKMKVNARGNLNISMGDEKYFLVCEPAN